MAAEILTKPEPHYAQSYVLTGGEVFTDQEVGALASEISGREIRYVDLPPEQLAQGLESQGMPPYMVDSWLGLENVKASGWAEEVSPLVAEILAPHFAR